MKKLILLLLFLVVCSCAWAVTIPVTVETTQTQVIIRYTSTIAGACTFGVSESVSGTPQVNDTDSAQFTGANSDARSTLNLGLSRVVVIGAQAYQANLSGVTVSRALQVNTPHFGTLACNTDTGTFAFTTNNAPFAPPPISQLYSTGAFGNYLFPQIDFTNKDKTYIDALTGILIKRITSPGDVGDGSNMGSTWLAPYDKNAAWTGLSNLLGIGGSYASYAGTGTTADYLFLPFPNIGIGGDATYQSRNVFIDLRANFTGFSDNSVTANSTLDGCLSEDHGQTCFSKTIDFPQLPNGIGSAAVVQFPGSYPGSLFPLWTATNSPAPANPQIAVRTGLVNMAGTAVTRTSGDTFQGLVPGDWITITGSGCPNSDQCVITTVTDQKHLVVATSATLTGAAYQLNEFGLKVWKKSATGTISLNTARFDYTFDTMMGTPDGGETSPCSNFDAPTTIDRNGTPLGFTLHGNLCALQDQYGNARLYWIGLNGESRHIANLSAPSVSSPAADAHGFLQSACFQGGSGNWDQNAANILYCQGVTAGVHPVVFKVVYNVADATWGNYKEWSNSYNLNTENPAMTVINFTPASSNLDLATQVTNFVSGFKPSYFTTYTLGNARGNFLSLLISVQQNSFGYFARINTTTGLVTQVLSTFGDPNMRWCGVHGSAGNFTPAYGAIYCAPLVSQTATGIGQFQSIPTFINGASGTALTMGFDDAATCETLGVTNPAYIATGATGNNCIIMHVDSEPYNPNPSATDLSTWPYTSGSITCTGCSQLQNAVEGDYFHDAAANVDGEAFRLVKKTGITGWVMQRGTTAASCTGNVRQAHSNGWVMLAWPGGVCSATFYWIDTSNNVLVDYANMNGGHHDFLTNITANSGTYIQSNYNVRTGNLPAQIGQPATFNSFGSFGPLYNNSSSTVSSGIVQSHPSARQQIASANESRWMVDARPPGLSQGGATLLFTNTVNSTAIANVYRVTVPTDGISTTYSTLDRKNLPVFAWAGKYLLQDKSGPGSVLATGDAWKFCVADFAGECVSGSNAGDVFMNVPQADTSGQCQTQFELNTPCWVSASSTFAQATQVGADIPDPTGTYFRNISSFFNGLDWPSNFWNIRSMPAAGWAFTNAQWLNNQHTDLVLAKLPPWPAQSTSDAMGFKQLPFQFAGISGYTRRIRFGYNTNLYCTTRLEACSTAGAAPYTWVSEAQTWTNCTSACTVTVPAIIGRPLYYIVDTKDGGGNVVSSPVTQVVMVN